MKCETCGSEIQQKDAVFCPMCGKRIIPKGSTIRNVELLKIYVENDRTNQRSIEMLKEAGVGNPNGVLEYLKKDRPVETIWALKVRYNWHYSGNNYEFFATVKQIRNVCASRDDVTIVASEKTLTKTTTTSNKFGVDVFWTKEEAEQAANELTERYVKKGRNK